MLQPLRAAGLLLALALTTTSCDSAPVRLTGSLALPIARLHAATTSTISGTVLAPPGLSAVPAMASARRVSALDVRPLAGAMVSLTDASGVSIPGVAPVVTDADGWYRFETVPNDRTVIVSVLVYTEAGNERRLMTLTVTRGEGVVADVSAGTTALAAAVLRSAREGALDLEQFTETAGQVGKALAATDLDRLESPDLFATAALAPEEFPCDLALSLESLLGLGEAVQAADCLSAPTPSATPGRSGGGGRGGGGSSRPAATGGLQTDISISDGPVLAATPSPTPTPTPTPTPIVP